MGKNRLVIDPDYDFELYGIITSIKEYKLAWELNSRLEIRLVKQPDIRLELIKDGPLLISNFEYGKDYLTYKLIKNKSVDQSVNKVNYLLPELQKFDYFLIINGQFKAQNDIISKLKEITIIDYISRFNANEVKSKENLIF